MGIHRHYTSEELKFVKKNVRGRSYVEMVKMFNKRFHPGITIKQMETLMYKHKFHNGLGTINGYPPPNKGKKGPASSRRKPVGYERVQQGYVEIKTAQPNVFEKKHAAIWKAAHGKVPKGHVVIFADGNRRNFDLENLMLITRKELVVMNRCHLISGHKDLTVVGKTIADVKMAIGKRTKTKRHKKPRRTAGPYQTGTRGTPWKAPR